MSRDLLTEVARQAARLRTQRHRHPVKVRVHPLDIAFLRSRYAGRRGVKPGEIEISRICGVPVEPDCAVARGEPVADYE